MYARMAATGQSWQPECPKSTSAPEPNWSHLDLRRWNLTIVAADRSLTATSPQLRCKAGLYEVSASTSSSPSRKKPKNAAVAIAQYTALSGPTAVTSGLCNRRSTVTVIGRRVLGDLPPRNLSLLMPSKTRFRMGSEDWSRGGGSPRESCVLRTADKYDLMVWGAKPSFARAVAK